MRFAREENDLILFDSVPNLNELLHFIQFLPLLFAQHDAIVQVSKLFKVQTYHKTLISYESRCLNSRQEEVREQQDAF